MGCKALHLAGSLTAAGERCLCQLQRLRIGPQEDNERDQDQEYRLPLPPLAWNGSEREQEGPLACCSDAQDRAPLGPRNLCNQDRTPGTQASFATTSLGIAQEWEGEGSLE